MTLEQRARFLDELRLTGNRQFAARAAEVTMSAAYDERDRRPLFEIQWREAERVAFAELQKRLHA